MARLFGTAVVDTLYSILRRGQEERYARSIVHRMRFGSQTVPSVLTHAIEVPDRRHVDGCRESCQTRSLSEPSEASAFQRQQTKLPSPFLCWRETSSVNMNRPRTNSTVSVLHVYC